MPITAPIGRALPRRRGLPLAPNLASEQASGLVAWYPFVENGGATLFEAVRGARAAITGTPAWRLRTEGPAHRFTSTLRATHSNDALLNLDRKTIACWVYLETAGANAVLVVANVSGGADRWLLWKDNGSGALNYSHTWSGANAQWAAPNSSLSANALHHLVLSYDRTSTGQPKMWINGVAQTVTTITSPSGSASGEIPAVITIGNRENETRPIEGQVYDLRIHNRLADQRWVDALYRPDTRWELYCRSTRRVLPLASGAELAAAVEGKAATAAVPTTQIPIAAAALTVATADGALTTQIPLAGAVAAAGNVAGNLSTQIVLTGAALGQALAQAGLDTQITLAGAPSGQAQAAADLTVQIRLQGAAVAAAAATGSLDSLAGAVQASGATAGALTTEIPLVGQAQAAAIQAGALSTQIPLASVLTGQGATSGALATAIALQGTHASASNATGDLTVSIALSAQALAQAVAAGALATQIVLSGAALANASVAGTLGAPLGPPSAKRLLKLARERRLLKPAAERRLLRPH